MIYVDFNIPMYLVGNDTHPNRALAKRILSELMNSGEKLVTDAEVYQEILHRYAAIDRKPSIQMAFDALDIIIDECFPVTFRDVVAAKEVLLAYSGVSSRDALHVAIMRSRKITRILTFDQEFDRIPEIVRVVN